MALDKRKPRNRVLGEMMEMALALFQLIDKRGLEAIVA